MAGNPITPTVEETLLLTDTSSTALVVGGAIGATTGTGGIKAGPIVSSSSVSDSVGTIATVRAGGIGIASQAAGDVIIGASSTALGRVASPSDATKFLNGAATPAFALVKDSDLSTTDVTTNDVSTTKHGFAPKAPSNSLKFLNGANPPAWAVPASAAAIVLSTDFADIGRFLVVVGGAASAVITDQGLHLATNNNTADYVSTRWQYGTSLGPAGSFTGVVFSATFRITTLVSFSAWIGISDVSNPIVNNNNIGTITDRCFGFRVLNGTQNLIATQADGTTGATSTLATGLIAGDVVSVLVRVDSTTAATYFYRKNADAWSAGVQIATNLPAQTGWIAMAEFGFDGATAAAVNAMDVVGATVSMPAT